MEKTLIIEPCTLAEALPFLVKVTRAKADTCAGLATVQDICRNSQAFTVKSQGQTIAGYALEPYQYERGDMLFVTAGAGALEGIDLSETMCRAVEIQARKVGAKAVGLMTKRRGLIKKLKAQGWEVAGIKMVKKL